MKIEGAVGLDIPNNQYPYQKPTLRYGNQTVPTPTNTQAKSVNPAKIMRQVQEGK